MRKIQRALWLLAFCCTIQANSQLTGYEWEIDTAHCGDYGDGYDLSGFVTHRLWITFESEEDQLSAVWSSIMDECNDPDEQDVSFAFDCELFQHEAVGGPLGNDQGWCVFGDSFPSAEFDSFVTIGTDCQSNPCVLLNAALCPVFPIWAGEFEGPVNGDYFDGGDIWIDDGAWFATSDQECTAAGADLRVLAAQFTTCGSIDFCFSVQAFIESTGTDTLATFCGVQQNPCLEFPLNPVDNILSDIGCFGELATVQIGDGSGNGAIQYSLFDNTDPLIPIEESNSNVFENLAEGSYFVALIDEIGCKDTSDVFEFTEPEPLELSAQITEENFCFGDSLAQICAEFSGGTAPYVVYMNENEDSLIIPGCFSELPCGSVTLEIYDAGTCVESLQLDLPCFEQLLGEVETTHVSCYGLDNGQFEISCSGGTGVVEIISPTPGFCPATLENFAAGEHELILQDENGCQFIEELEIQEPEELIVTFEILEEISCGAYCDASVLILAEGGDGSYELLLDGASVDAGQVSDLCAGTYELILTDASSCEDMATFSLLEPVPIEVQVESSSTSCSNECDGNAVIEYTGGTGELTLVLDQEDLDLEALCAGEHGFVVIDSEGCELSGLLSIGSQAIADFDISVFSTPVTCWNEFNGTATIAVFGENPPFEIQWGDQVQQNTSTIIGLGEGFYTVNITDGAGCTTDTTITISANEGCFFISTALTPNGDGVNDHWILGGLEYFPDATVQVYNRWGQLLYESIGYSVPWDGKHNGRKLPASDYYYIIKYDDAEELLTGSVTIKY